MFLYCAQKGAALQLFSRRCTARTGGQTGVTPVQYGTDEYKFLISCFVNFDVILN